ncbi:MAG: hypothetical protein WDW36_002925 [Sanguina aurantia]
MAMSSTSKRSVTAKVSYWIHKELLLEVLESIRMQAHSSSAKQYLHGWYRSTSSSFFEHQWGIHHSSMLCFPRISLLWHKLLPTRSRGGSVISKHGDSGNSSASDRNQQAEGSNNGWYPHRWRWDVLVMRSRLPTLQQLLSRAAIMTEAAATGRCSRPRSLWWPWQQDTGACDAAVPPTLFWTLFLTCPAALVAHDCLEVSSANRNGPDEVVPGKTDIQGVRSELVTPQARSRESCTRPVSGATHHPRSQATTTSPGQPPAAAPGAPPSAHDSQPIVPCSQLPTRTAPQVAPDQPWLVLYACLISVICTWAEARALAACLLRRHLSLRDKLCRLACSHLLTAVCSVLGTGLLTAWLPSLNPDTASPLLWLHLLGLPALNVWAMWAAWELPVRVLGTADLLLSGEVGCVARSAPPQTGRSCWRGVSTASNRVFFIALEAHAARTVVWTDASHPLQHGTQAVAQSDPVGLLRQNLRFVHRRRSSAAAGAPLAEGGAAAAAAQLPRAPSASAAAAAAIHWPPPLEIPPWLEEVQDVPEAFRCPITLGIMREPTQASSGVTYERTAIFKWLDHHRVDPVCHVSVKRHRLTPNLSLRSIIEVWVREREDARLAKEKTC